MSVDSLLGELRQKEALLEHAQKHGEKVRQRLEQAEEKVSTLLAEVNQLHVAHENEKTEGLLQAETREKEAAEISERRWSN